MLHSNFFIVRKLGPIFKKQHTRFRRPIFVEEKIAMFLARLGTKYGLCMVVEIHRVAEYTISRFLREFCKIVGLHLQKIFI